MSSAPPVNVVRERFGAVERIVFTPDSEPRGASVSVFRIGDTVVDTGGKRVESAVLEVLAESPIRQLLLTHQHEDHTGNVGAIRERFGAIPIHAPRAILPILADFDRVPPYREVYWGRPTPIPSDWLIPYDEGDRFEVDGLAIDAIHAPGHTPPHHVFALRDGASTIVISGDLYASRPLDALFESACEDTIRSYRRIASLDGELTLLPTHGWVRPDARAMLREGADWLERESAAIHDDARSFGTRDPIAIAEHRYGPDRTRRISAGEMGSAVFVRSVLEPTRTLPATPLVG